MTAPRLRKVASAGLFVAAVVMATAWVGLAASRPDLPGLRSVEAGDGPFVLAYLVFCGVGAAIAGHRGGAVGWALLAAGFFQVMYVFSQEYAVRALATDAGLPAGSLAAWVSFNVSPLGFVAFPVFLLVFPTGRPVSRRWAAVVWATLGAGLIVLAGALANWPVRGIAMLAAEPQITSDIADDLFLASMWALTASAVLATVSLVVRYVRAAHGEREQLKWVVYAGALFVGVMALDAAGVLGQGDPLIVTTLAALAIAAIPAAAFIAVTRYRLYDIDRIISRTVSYFLVSALLAGVYLGSVTVLTTVTASATRRSPLAVAAATLAAAAAFGPARRRIQGAVDRRFNRARYDAARTAEAYRARLRDQLELDGIAGDLVETARAAVQPTSALVWLRTTGSVQ